jgi:HlyD family secretion protein
MKKHKKKLIIGGIVLVAAIALVLTNLNGSSNGQTSVQVDLAVLGDISEVVTASGQIHPQTKVDISAEVSAQIIELFAAEGDRVSKGQRLLLLDTIQVMADVAQARFSLDEITARTEAARIQYDRDKLEFERQTNLFDKKLVSETVFTNARFTFENSKANFDAMAAQVKIGRTRLAKMEDNLAKTNITAPMDGIITYLKAEVGEIAQAQTSYTQGKTLMTVSDLSVFEVEIDVDETEIAKVRMGQDADIRVDAFRDTVFAGTIVEIGNSASVEGQGTESYTTSFRVKVRFAETQALIRPGMSASVDITTAHEDEALLIPYASVVTREFDPDSLKALEQNQAEGEQASGELMAAPLDDNSQTDQNEDDSKADKHKKKKEKIKKTGVFIVDNGSAKFVELTTGIADDRDIIAMGDLNPGDTVISGSFQTLRKIKIGDEVKIDEQSMEKLKEDEE